MSRLYIQFKLRKSHYCKQSLFVEVRASSFS